MSKFANARTQKLRPYVPGEQPKEKGLIKLNTNESPFPPGEKVREALRSFEPESLRLYPDPESTALREKLAKIHGFRKEEVFVGNGSDEILALIFQSFFEADGAPLLFPGKTYSFYEVYARRYGIPFEKVPLAEGERIRIEDYERAGQAVILANPNAPTGRLLDPPEIAALCRQDEARAVFVDEAYIDFAPAGTTALSLLADYENLMVIQTFSKSRNLAGLRVGMAFASEAMTADLIKQKNCFNSYPIDRIAQNLACAALDESGYYRHCCSQIKEIREETAAALEAAGFEVTPSAANFLWIRHPEISGGRLYRAMRSRRILLRHWDQPELQDYLRVTIGTKEDMTIFLQAIRDILTETAENDRRDTQ